MATNASDSTGPMHDLTSFQRDIIRLIDDLDDGEAPHGLAIKAALSRAYDGAKINHGRLYPNLDELESMGLVEKGSKDRRTNSYALSARGERELDAHREWLGAGE